MRIGLLGGTFDPIHAGHLAIALHVLTHLSLDRIEFMPCFAPPHRSEPLASPAHRLAMAQLAIANFPLFAVNTLELTLGGISYTADTLDVLQKKFPDNRYYFIIGADAFAHLPAWDRFEKIPALCDIVVINRNTTQISIPAAFTAFMQKNPSCCKIHYLTMEPVIVSATQIRADLLANNQPIRGLPAAVHAYILRQNVY
jgi:nicotinate-nucleotide adenylyltransferase